MRGEAFFQSLLSVDENRFGHIGVVAAIEDVVGRGDGQEGVEDVVGGRSGKVVVEARQVGVDIHRLHDALFHHYWQQRAETREGIRQKRAAVRHNHLQVRVTYQHVVGYHVENSARGLGKVFVACQWHVGNQLCVDRRGLVGMQDDNGVLLVEVGHQCVEGGVAEVLPIAVRGQLDAVGSQNLKGVASLLQSMRHIRQGQCGTEKESAGIACLQCSALLVVSAAHRCRGLRIAKEWLRCRHGEHGGLDAGLVHKGDVALRIPAGDREPFVHLGTVGLDVFEVALRDGVAVEVDLCHGWQC